jgi:hypothetical protein
MPQLDLGRGAGAGGKDDAEREKKAAKHVARSI